MRSVSSRFFGLFVAFLVFALARTAGAHGSRTAYLDVTAVGDEEAVASLRSDPRSPLALTSSDCSIDALTGAAGSGPTTMLRLRCPRGLGGATLAVSGLRESADVVVVRVVLEHGDAQGAVLTARSPSFDLPAPASRGGPSVFGRYVRIGVEHVLSGLDHLLFLLALVWQALAASRGSLRTWVGQLARAATAFTVAHTVTLAATTLGWLHVAPEAAEAMIAVSLVLMALDLGRPSAAAKPLGLGVVIAFGLVHGLGFAGALGGARLPENAVALGLFGFNVGVELGQGLFLAAAVVAITLLCRSPALGARAPALSAYVIGATGAYLVIARSTFLFR